MKKMGIEPDRHTVKYTQNRDKRRESDIQNREKDRHFTLKTKSSTTTKLER